MPRVGQVVTIPTVSSGNITLDSRETVVVGHDPDKAALAGLATEEALARAGPLFAPSSSMTRAVRRLPRTPRVAGDVSREGDTTG